MGGTSDKAGEANDKAARFRPRRLGHANLFVSDLDRSMAFYNRVCGLEEVRREPGISAGFLSNGNTHHDVGLMQVGDRTRIGVGGHVQVAKSRMRGAGLNHLGWEMENEKQLVEAYERARAAGVDIHRTTDHQISHSVYVFDPEGNLNEFYADSVEDWREVFNPTRDDLVSGHWDPMAEPPSETPMYDPDPQLRRVEDAAFHALRITHAVLVVRDLDLMRRFYEEVGGLTPLPKGAEDGFVRLTGTRSRCDLVLFSAEDNLPPGLHHVSFEVDDESLDRGASALKDLRLTPERCIDNEAKRSIFVRDPDGIGVELYRPKSGTATAGQAAAGEQRMQPYLV